MSRIISNLKYKILAHGPSIKGTKTQFKVIITSRNAVVRFELGIVEVNALETDFNVIKKELDVFPSSTDLCTDKDF